MQMEMHLQQMFEELVAYELREVRLKMDGSSASPMQIVQAHTVREDSSYMRDYILDESGNLEELCFQEIKKR